MKEIWEQAILSYNLPLTVTLGLVLLFWLFALLGTLDLDSFDFDFDADGDIDTDVTPSGHGFLNGILKFVNATDVPIMMVLSFMTITMWAIAILSNAALNPGQSWLVASGLLAGNFIVSCIVVKVITQPFKRFFRAFKKGENDDEPIIGQVGTVKSRVIDAKYGQVEITRRNGAPAIVNCRLSDDLHPLVRGDQVLVFDRDKEKNLFIARNANVRPDISESDESTESNSKTTTTTSNTQTTKN